MTCKSRNSVRRPRFERLEPRWAMDVAAAVNLEQLMVTGTDVGEEALVDLSLEEDETPHAGSQFFDAQVKVLEGGSWIAVASFDHVILSSVEVRGGDGNDTLWYQVADTSYYPTADIYGHAGVDVLHGSVGPDNLYGGSGAD